MDILPCGWLRSFKSNSSLQKATSPLFSRSLGFSWYFTWKGIMLERAGWSIGNVERFEISEAFAAIPLAVMHELGLPEDIVNIDEILGQKLMDMPSPVHDAHGLFAMNIDPEAAAEAYRRRVLQQIDPQATEAKRAAVREQVSGACTTEMATFDE